MALLKKFRESTSSSIDRLLQKLILLPIDNPKTIVALSFLAFLFFLFGIFQLRVQVDMYSAVDNRFASAQHQATMDEEFGDANSLFLTLVSKNPISNKSACSIKTFLASYQRANAEIEYIKSPWSLRQPQIMQDSLWYPLILSDPCELAPTLFLTAEGPKLATTPWAHLFAGIAPGQIAMDVKLKNSDEVKNIASVYGDIQNFIEQKHPELEVHFIGPTSLRYYMHKVLKKDSKWNIGILIFLAIFFYYFLGTWRAGLFYGISLLFTEIFVFGLMGWIGYPIDIMSNCLFLMTTIAGVSDFLFVTSAQKEGESWESSFLTVATPSFFTSMTTVVGFFSLGFSDIPAISRFGLVAGCGALFQYLATYVILPGFLKFFGVRQTWVKQKKHQQISAGWFMRMNKFVPPKWLTHSLVIVSFIGVFFFHKMNIGEDILGNFPASHPFPKTHQWLYQDKGWQGQIYVLFFPESTAEKNLEVIRALEQIPDVAFVDSALKVENFLTKDLSPLKKDLVLREASETVLKPYRSSAGYSRLSVYLKTWKVPRLQEVVTRIKRICADQCVPTGRTVTYLELSERISTSLLESLLSSIVSIVLFIVFLAWLKQSPHSLALIVSSLWGPLIMILILSVFQIPVSSVTSIFFSLIVGWTGDNAIQYMYANESILEGAEQRAPATLMQTLMFCGSSVFLLAQTLVPLKILGLLFILGFFLTYVGDLWILKGLVGRKAK